MTNFFGYYLQCSCGWSGFPTINDTLITSTGKIEIACPNRYQPVEEGTEEYHNLKFAPEVEEPKKKMLFVDDRTKRIHYALNNFGGYEVTIATCVPEALRQMVKEDYDIISLDHDLNGHDFQYPETETCGMEIVRYLEKTGWPSGASGIHKPIPEFWIHSSNLFAAHLMIVRLSAIGLSAYFKPINYKVENMKYDEKGVPI